MQKIINAVSATLMIALMLIAILNLIGIVNLDIQKEFLPIVVVSVITYLILKAVSKSMNKIKED